MKPKSTEIVTPSPFFKIEFGCSNRAFYQVKNELYEIGDKIGIEIQDGYVTEECDYEGDLERIIIYGEDRSKELRKAILEFYRVKCDVDEYMKIVLSI